MAWSIDVGSPYHQQDTDYYCGAAVAQMVLDSIGSGLLDQDVLYNSNHSHNTLSGWATDPNGLRYTLNNLMPPPPTFDSFFVVDTRDAEALLSHVIASTLWVYKVAPCVLVEGSAHWIEVHGVQTDVDPISNATYNLNGFMIHNPWPYVPSFVNPMLAPPPPHSGTDGCGSGGTRGDVNEYAAYDTTWKDTYLTGADVWGVGHSQFIAVCDPRRPKFGELNMRRQRGPMTRGDRIIDPEEVERYTVRGIEMHDLLSNKVFNTVLKGARASKPLLVQRLDLPDTFYYLTPMLSGETVTSVLSVDGRFGDFRGALVLGREKNEQGQGSRSHIIDREEVLKKVLSNPLELRSELGRLTVREGAFCLYPTLVWRPCKESLSPYYPFYMLTVGGRTIYIGYDGTVYTQLHNASPGS